MKKLTIYLAGACKNVPDEGQKWREDVTEKLKAVAGWSNCRLVVVNPTTYFSYKEKKHQHDKQIMSYYFDRIRHSDLILVNLNNSEDSCGTCMELQYAYDHDISIIGFGTENVYNWTIPLTQVQFQNSTEAIDYIRDYYMWEDESQT